MVGTPPAGASVGPLAATATASGAVGISGASEDASINRFSCKGTCNARTIHAIKYNDKNTERQRTNPVDTWRHLPVGIDGMGGKQC